MTWAEGHRALRDLGFNVVSYLGRDGTELSAALLADVIPRCEVLEDSRAAIGDPLPDIWRLVAGSELHDGLGCYVRASRIPRKATAARR